MAMPVFFEDLGVNLTVGVTRNRVGTNGFHLEMTDRLGNPVAARFPPTVHFSRLDQQISVEPVLLEPNGNGRYYAKSDVLGIVGSWVANVSAKTQQGDAVEAEYLSELQSPHPPRNRLAALRLYEMVRAWEAAAGRVASSTDIFPEQLVVTL